VSFTRIGLPHDGQSKVIDMKVALNRDVQDPFLPPFGGRFNENAAFHDQVQRLKS